MNYIWHMARKLAGRNKKKILLINIQFMFMFLFIMILTGTLVKLTIQSNFVDSSIWSDAWKVFPSFSDSEEKDLEDWKTAQFDYLKATYSGRIGVLHEDYSEVENEIITIRVNNVLWKLINKNKGTEALYMGNWDAIKLSKEIRSLKIEKRATDQISSELLDLLDPLSRGAYNNIIFLQGDPADMRQITLYLFDTKEKKLNINLLVEKISKLNDGKSYAAIKLIEANKQSVEGNTFYTKAIFVFIILSSILVLMSVISFTIVRFQGEARKFRIFQLYGATRSHLISIILFSNLFLVGPAFLIALLLISSIGFIFLPIKAIFVAIGIGSITFVTILVLLTVPSAQLNRTSLKLNEI